MVQMIKSPVSRHQLILIFALTICSLCYNTPTKLIIYSTALIRFFCFTSLEIFNLTSLIRLSIISLYIYKLCLTLSLWKLALQYSYKVNLHFLKLCLFLLIWYYCRRPHNSLTLSNLSCYYASASFVSFNSRISKQS